MKIDSVAALVGAISRNKLLEAHQIEELNTDLLPRFTDPRSLAKELLRRDWLTAYQINLLFQGRDAELVLGRYVLLDRLGEGAIGPTYRARHAVMRRQVGLQVIHENLLAQEEMVALFYQEIQAVSRLRHPNLVEAFDAGPIGRTHFLVMEFVPGIDLASLVRQRGPLPPVLACDFIHQALHGLNHAWEQGLRHHDLRPINILVVRRAAPGGAPDSGFRLGQQGLGDAVLEGALVKIRNLGLTLLEHHPDLSPPKPKAGDPKRPQNAAPAQSPAWVYHAPEQLRDPQHADIRADLYSLGCTLCYVLSGFDPEPSVPVLDQLSARFVVPESLLQFLARLTAARPEDRFQSPAEVAFALVGLNVSEVPLLTPRSEVARPPAPRVKT